MFNFPNAFSTLLSFLKDICASAQNSVATSGVPYLDCPKHESQLVAETELFSFNHHFYAKDLKKLPHECSHHVLVRDRRPDVLWIAMLNRRYLFGFSKNNHFCYMNSLKLWSA